MKTSWMYLLGTAFIVIAIGTFYFQSGILSKDNNEHNPIPLNNPISPTTVPQEIHSEASIQTIRQKLKTSLDNRTPALLYDIMTEKVTVTRLGTSCCGILSRQQVMPHFGLLQKAEGPWSIDEASIAAELKKLQPEIYEDKIIAVSQNEYVVAIQITATDLIDEIIISAKP